MTRSYKGSRRHEQIMGWVKFPMDRLVAPLVEALNEVSGVVTCDSCQCRPGEHHHHKASVAFQFFGADETSWARGAKRLAYAVRRADPLLSFGIEATWFGGHDGTGQTPTINPLLWFYVESEQIERAAAAIRVALTNAWVDREAMPPRAYRPEIDKPCY